jgi:hypothetical protein
MENLNGIGQTVNTRAAKEGAPRRAHGGRSRRAQKNFITTENTEFGERN